jgi:hypothetical protein
LTCLLCFITPVDRASFNHRPGIPDLPLADPAVHLKRWDVLLTLARFGRLAEPHRDVREAIEAFGR